MTRLFYTLIALSAIPMAYMFSVVGLAAWKAEPKRPDYPDHTLVEPVEEPEGGWPRPGEYEDY